MFSPKLIYSEEDLIKAVLLHPAKYSIDLLGILQLRTTDDETIEMHVEYHKGEKPPSDAHLVKKIHDGGSHRNVLLEYFPGR
jgi:hypothetical protein